MSKTFTLIALLVSAFIFTSKAQENSPYTRFGIGELRNQTPAGMRSWGSQTAAFHSRDRFNISNPASLGDLKLTNYQIGLYGKGLKVMNSEVSQNFGYATIDYITLAFPLKHAAVSFGLLPVSRVNYDVIEINEAANGLPKYLQMFKGDGSVNEVYLATGATIKKKLRVGIKGSFVFGNLRNATRLVFADTLNGFNSRYYNDRHLSGFAWLAGVQYDVKWKEKHTVTVGLAGHLKNPISSTRDMMLNRYFYYNSVEIAYDTIQSSFNQKGLVILPTQYDAGIMYAYQNKWLAGVNFNYIQASQYRSFDEVDSFKNAYKVSAGIQWIPNDAALEGLYNRMKFRLGGYYQLTPIYIYQTQLKKYALTAGFGLPVKRFFSDIDFSIEVGKIGTVKNNLLEERYILGTLGFSISDRWFIKRKYD